MYILDQNNNILQKAQVSTFKELGLEERKHLQEWIAAEPSSLGEELLIIQKEFDGFADTKERLDLGFELSAKIVRKQIAGKEVFSVDDDYLLACFDTDVNESTIEAMAKLLPTHLVIRDASADNDNVLDNLDQIIESYSNEKKINTHIL